MKLERHERHIGLSRIGKYHISTVLLPGFEEEIDYEPYETMIFDIEGCGWRDLYCERYETVETAQEGHERIVAEVQAGMLP